MTVRVPREWLKYEYLDPEKILVGLRGIANSHPLHQLRYEARSLRTHELRKLGEGRQGALFCYGMGQVIGAKVSFALVERQDFDLVARFEARGKTNYVPVQLKEWAPSFMPSPQPLQVELDKLAKYVDSKDLVVAFHLNREASVLLSELSFPQTIGELWFFGAAENSQSRWVLIGNLLTNEAVAHEFLYPEA